MMVRSISIIPWFLFILSLLVRTTTAQNSSELELRISRNFGYSSGSGRIQGTFTLKASGPSDLETVTFYIDDQVIGQVSEEPFHLRFNTSDYLLGRHRLYAVGSRRGGDDLRSNEIQVEFVSAEAGWAAGMRILIPILVIIFGALSLSVAVTLFSGRKTAQIPPGTPRNYGISGGAICPRCQRPFPRHFWSPNLGSGKLERCPFCGKWSLLGARSLDELRAAEAAELASSKGIHHEPALNEEERLRRELDETRFQDL